jgi:NAD(P)-dependent dehydrogenase (short-subunit alcohol dehydrogenase family)
MKVKELFSVEGKSAVVTGGSRGIGKMIADTLRENGCDVTILYHHIDEEEVMSTTKGYACDVTDLRQIKKTVSKINKCDILVNCAGTMFDDPMEEITREKWNHIFNLNTKAPFFLTQQLLPLLMKNGGSVVNIGSIAGLDKCAPQHKGMSYYVSKASLHHSMKVLAADLIDKKININTIAPGPYATSLMGREGIDYDLKRMEDVHVSGRLGNKNDIGGTVILLCSKAGSFITGETIELEGGLQTDANKAIQLFDEVKKDIGK